MAIQKPGDDSIDNFNCYGTCTCLKREMRLDDRIHIDTVVAPGVCLQ
jgi:hypothetical protein